MVDKTQSDFRRLVGRLRSAVMKDASLKPRDKVVASVMLDHIDRAAWLKTGELLTWNRVGVEAIATGSALTTRDVERARCALQQAGLIALHRPAAPSKGRAAQFCFRLDWLLREAVVADTGVADTGVGLAEAQPTESAGIADKTPAPKPTRESPTPCITRGIYPARVEARASPHLREDSAAAILAGQFEPTEIRRWFAGCRIELDGGGSAIIWAPERYIADWIRERFTDRLKAALCVFEVNVLVGVPPAIRAHLPSHLAGGRA